VFEQVRKVLEKLWHRIRCPLFVSWSTGAADVSDLSCVEVMLFNLRQRSWTLMMYLGLCSAATSRTLSGSWYTWRWRGHLRAATSPTADRQKYMLLSLIRTRVLCSIVNISIADTFSFDIPFIAALQTVRWIYRAVDSLRPVYSDTTQLN